MLRLCQKPKIKAREPSPSEAHTPCAATSAGRSATPRLGYWQSRQKIFPGFINPFGSIRFLICFMSW